MSDVLFISRSLGASKKLTRLADHGRMFHYQPIGARIKSLRTERGLSQAELADRCGLPRARLSNIERGARVPTPQQAERLAQALGLEMRWLVRNTDWLTPAERDVLRKRSTQVSQEFERLFVYQPPFDRDMSTRLRKAFATYSNLARARFDAIRRRADGEASLRVLSTVVAGSSLEVMAHLVFVERAEMVSVPPEPTGFRKHPVVDPKTREGVGSQPVPAYRIDIGDLRCLLIPQVGLACRKATWRVDFLGAVIDFRGNVHWFYIEIDGDGHDFGTDPFREEDIDMPLVRLTESDILGDSLLEILEHRIKQLFRLAA